VDGQALLPAAWPGRKTCQLLKILVAFRHRIVSSDELIEWLWPDLAPGSARNSLWVAVSRLRRVLEPGAGRGESSLILTQPPGYRLALAQGCDVDVDRFLAGIAVGQARQKQGEWAEAAEAYRAAEALYRGDYLCDDPYEQWTIPERERLREVFLGLQEALAACLLALDRCDEALAHARKALAQESCRESAWRLVMEGHYRAGDPAQALQAFARCRAALIEDLGVDPQPETVALHERILQHPAPMPPRPTPTGRRHLMVSSLHLPFVGRAREWLLLSDTLTSAVSGHGAVLLLAGPPGIGKTRLLEELAGLSIARGAQVLTGRCYELERNVAYAPLVEALRDLLPALAGAPPPCPPEQLAALTTLLPELGQLWPGLPPYQPLPADEERTRLLAALTQLIRGCACSHPAVLLLDDLQWADPSTLQAINYLGRCARDQTLLVVGAYRSTQVDPHHPLAALREQLAQAGVLTEIPLPTLEPGDVSLLLRLLSDESGTAALAEQLYRETEGHPFFLAEVLRTFVQEHLVTVDAAGRWRVAAGAEARLAHGWPLPANVRVAVLGRLDRLALDDRRLLDHAAVIGRAVSLPLLARLLDQPETTLAERADRLSVKGFLQTRPPDSYEFGHELMRRAAYEALSEPRRRLLHRQTAEALVEMDAPPGSVATHYAASDRPWLALEPALAAAEQAARVAAYEEALAWSRQAEAIAEIHPAALSPGFRTRLHLQQRTLWYFRGDLAHSLAADRAALDAALSEGDVAAEMQALWHLAHDETQAVAGGLSGLQARAVTLAHALGDAAAQARSLARLGSDTGFLAAPAERQAALDALDEAASLARQAGDSKLLHYVLCEFWGVGRLPQARAALEEALALVRRLADPHEEAGTLAKLADLLTRQGDFQAAIGYACEGIALAEQVGNPAYSAWNQRALGQALAALGEIDQGQVHLEAAGRTFAAHGWRAMLAGTLLRQGLIHQAAGRPERAIAPLESVVALSRETCEIYEEAYALALLGEARLMLGDPAAGGRDLDAATAALPRVGLPWHRAGILAHLAAGRLRQGKTSAALAAADEAVALAECEDLREARAQALQIREWVLTQQ
jgi:predicted ATPase/DNA-binding SARP family transcriptional activator